jgi:hypothetical protein
VIVGSDLIYYTYSEATPHSRLLLAALRAAAGPGTPIYLSLSLHHNPEARRARAARAARRVRPPPPAQVPRPPLPAADARLCLPPGPSTPPGPPPQEVARFLAWAAADGFDVSRVPPGDVPPAYRVPDVLIARLALRAGGGGDGCGAGGAGNWAGGCCERGGAAGGGDERRAAHRGGGGEGAGSEGGCGGRAAPL